MIVNNNNENNNEIPHLFLIVHGNHDGLDIADARPDVIEALSELLKRIEPLRVENQHEQVG